jgi:predicted helicase
MLHDNLGLITVRQVAEGIFDHAYCSDTIVESRITLSNKGIAYLFPLYLCSEKDNPKSRSSGSTFMLFEPKADYEVKKPNLSPTIIEQLLKNYKRTHSPEQIFFYIYAVLYSNIYRTKYAEFLKIDFPRVPFPKSYKLFIKMSAYGKRLVDLHLLKSVDLKSKSIKLQGKGEKKVEKIKYEKRKVFINKAQYFEGIAPEVWEYQIGGYQVCDKWLKERKGITLSLNDIKHYCEVITAIQKTIEIQKAIDKIYPEVEKETIEFAENKK